MKLGEIREENGRLIFTKLGGVYSHGVKQMWIYLLVVTAMLGLSLFAAGAVSPSFAHASNTWLYPVLIILGILMAVMYFNVKGTAGPIEFIFDRQENRLLKNGQVLCRLDQVQQVKMQHRLGANGQRQFRIVIISWNWTIYSIVETHYILGLFDQSHYLIDTMSERSKFGIFDEWMDYQGEQTGWDKSDTEIFDILEKMTQFF